MGCTDKSGVLFLSAVTAIKRMVGRRKERDKSIFCNLSTCSWVHLTSHSMHSAHVTGSFFGAFAEEKSPFAAEPGCQPSVFS